MVDVFKVVCIRDKSAKQYLTKGNEYKAKVLDKWWYEVKCDDGIKRSVKSNRFELIK